MRTSAPSARTEKPRRPFRPSHFGRPRLLEPLGSSFDCSESGRSLRNAHTSTQASRTSRGGSVIHRRWCRTCDTEPPPHLQPPSHRVLSSERRSDLNRLSSPATDRNWDNVRRLSSARTLLGSAAPLLIPDNWLAYAPWLRTQASGCAQYLTRSPRSRTYRIPPCHSAFTGVSRTGQAAVHLALLPTLAEIQAPPDDHTKRFLWRSRRASGASRIRFSDRCLPQLEPPTSTPPIER